LLISRHEDEGTKRKKEFTGLRFLNGDDREVPKRDRKKGEGGRENPHISMTKTFEPKRGAEKKELERKGGEMQRSRGHLQAVTYSLLVSKRGWKTNFPIFNPTGKQREDGEKEGGGRPDSIFDSKRPGEECAGKKKKGGRENCYQSQNRHALERTYERKGRGKEEKREATSRSYSITCRVTEQ